MIITEFTDLTQFAGKRVVISHGRHALICSINHRTDSMFEELRGGFGGVCIEDPHGDCQGGNTSFWWPYGTDVTLEETR